MDPRSQKIALEAYRRGFLDEEAFAAAVVELVEQPAYDDDIWLENRWLDEAQLAECQSVVMVETAELDLEAVQMTEAEPETDPAQVFEKAKTGMFLKFADPDQTGLFEKSSETMDFEGEGLSELSDLSEMEVDPALGESTEFYVSQVREKTGPTRYVLGDELGKGGGGRVIRAFDRLLGRTVAMKILSRERRKKREPLRRFLVEAKTTGQLEHPNIVPIYDVGKLSTGELYYTMREVRRRSLRDALIRIKTGEKHAIQEYSMVHLMTIVQRLCDAVAYAHSRSIIHRDIKPDNIMLGDFGEVLVTDWGLARMLNASDPFNNEAHTMGTPAYMPPEQARGELEHVDQRSDIYSIGAVLYEVLTLEPPFTGENPIDIMLNVVDQKLVPPRERVAKDVRKIPTALNDICVRAMSKNPEDRYQNAADIGDDLEHWITGIQAGLSHKKINDGKRAARLYDAFNEQVQKLTDQVKQEAGMVEAWEAIENKRTLWKLEDERARAEVERARAYGEAVSHYLQALAHKSDDREARRGLADLYWKRRQLARSIRDEADAVYYETLTLQYDDGHYRALLQSPASVQLTTEPDKARVTIARLEANERVLVPGRETDVGFTPLEINESETGTFQVRCDHPERASVSFPIVLRRGQREDISVRLPTPEELKDGFVFVPGGPFIRGGDNDAFDPRPRKTVEVGDFFCAIFPVTFREYLQWINELFKTDPDRALKHAPQTRGAEGLLVRKNKEGIWVPHEILIEGPARQMYPEGRGHEWNIPVVGIRHADALAYCEWRGKKLGVNLRLLTENEWEKAGRGVDGRFFPWGDHFDATFCKMRFSRPDLPQLEPVGMFKKDTSPYGVRDLAGGVQEWCASNNRDQVEQPIRGGAWNQDIRASRLAGRVEVLGAARTAGIGFRVAYGSLRDS